MSLLFCDDGEDENEEVEAANAMVMATKDATLCAMTATVLETPKILGTPLLAITLLVVIPKEESDSMKPAGAVEKGKGPIMNDEAKKAIEEDMSLGEDPFDQEIGGQRYRACPSIVWKGDGGEADG
jgi:hypothetical protein